MPDAGWLGLGIPGGALAALIYRYLPSEPTAVASGDAERTTATH